MAYAIKCVGWMSIVTIFLMIGCSVFVDWPADPKTVLEQPLISQALENSLTDLNTAYQISTKNSRRAGK